MVQEFMLKHIRVENVKIAGDVYGPEHTQPLHLHHFLPPDARSVRGPISKRKWINIARPQGAKPPLKKNESSSKLRHVRTQVARIDETLSTALTQKPFRMQMLVSFCGTFSFFASLCLTSLSLAPRAQLNIIFVCTDYFRRDDFGLEKTEWKMYLLPQHSRNSTTKHSWKATAKKKILFVEV